MDLGDVLWAMLVFFFWFMLIWMFIAVFVDLFRRRDLSGWGKAGWMLLLVVLPLIGLLAYVIARPRPTEEELRRAGVAFPTQGGGPSAADELTKLVALRDAGEITPEEFATLKRRTTVGA